MKNKYFIGKEYHTLKEKNDILESYDKLYRDKLDFLNELYDNENTLKRFWSTYTRHIHKHELLLEKDAMFFDENEVDSCIASRFKYSRSMKDGILFFIRTYKSWGMGRGDIQGNSADTINRKTATKTSKKVLENKLWGLGEFYNLLIEIEQKSNTFGAIAFLLARYGIAGKQLINMRCLRWEDIDYEKKQVKIIEDGRLIRIVDVDDRFLQWIDKYRIEKCPDETDFGYVLKKQRKSKDGGDLIENYNTINSRTYVIARDLKIPRIAFGDVLKSRYIDLLLEIRATRKLTTDDITWVLMNFNDSVSNMTAHNLKEIYQTLAKEEVIFKNNLGKPQKTLKDPNAKEFVEKLRKDIDFQEYVNNEERWENKEIDEVTVEVSISKVED